MRYEGIQPYVRLVGVLLILLALGLIFGVVVGDLLFAVSAIAFAVGAVLAAVPGWVLGLSG